MYKLWDVIRMLHDDNSLRFEDEKGTYEIGFYMGQIKIAKTNGGFFMLLHVAPEYLRKNWRLKTA